MENKPYLVGIASNHDGVERYLASIPNVARSVESILVSYSPQIDANKASYVDQIRRINEPWPGNLYRFKDFPMDLDPERMVIFTDVGDVWFQDNVPELKKDIYVCPEYDFFGKENWFKQHLEAFNFHYLDGEPIYNMGTWAMPVKKAYELIKFLEENSHYFGHWSACDQPLYNWWLQRQEFTTHPRLMTCLYGGLGTGHVTKSEAFLGKYYYHNEEGQPFAIVHANGSTKEKA